MEEIFTQNRVAVLCDPPRPSLLREGEGGSKYTFMDNYDKILKYTRGLRKSQTDAEELLWSRIRKRQLNGKKFLRQFAILYGSHLGSSLFYIVDFYCFECKLVVEVDGKIHDAQKEQDMKRDKRISNLGNQVLRFRNEEVLGDLEGVLEKIKRFLDPPRPSL
jgi:very-short-patch-repair endonuclease